jgi:cytochrome c biogenesis protein CcmG, thiol:disulfide interchange protein DsbE
MCAKYGTVYVLLVKLLYLTVSLKLNDLTGPTNEYFYKTHITMKNFILALLIFTTLGVVAQNTQTMPDISLKDVNGKTKNVNEYSKSGKITVISFWATWCTPCKKEISNINDLLDDWKEKYGLELVIVSVDDARNVPKVKPYVDGQGWDFDCLLDVNRDLARTMNVLNPPQTFLLNQKGEIVWSHIGYLEGDEFMLEEKIKALVPAK